MTSLYDPLTWENLMAGVVVRFEQQPCVSFTEIDNADGPGVYTLFYTGPHPAYTAISGTPRPIYVGKAVPRGTRKGSMEGKGQYALRNRLNNHRRSIEDSINLQLDGLPVPLPSYSASVGYIGRTVPYRPLPAHLEH